jgi:ABC-2 type transport system permease protein
MQKEFRHIVRDPRSLAVVFIMPLFMIFIYGYSISYDLERVDTALVDLSGGEAARQLARQFSASGIFVLHQLKSSPGAPAPLEEGERLLREGRAGLMLVIPAGFARDLEIGQTAQVGVIIDGSDTNTANLVYQYSEQAVQRFILERQGLENLVKISTKMFFNPDVKSYVFFIPGLIAVLLMMISALLTSISVARERESGSLDLLFISPLKSSEIIVGKTLPYLLISFLIGALILFFARFWFGIPFRGSLLVLVLFSLLYLLSGLSFGILISTSAPDQRVAMIATLMITMLPSIMLSGFIFPLDSLALPLRALSYMVPATYYLRIIRGVILKGASLRYFLFEGGMMALYSLVMIVAAVRRFSRQREVAK